MEIIGSTGSTEMGAIAGLAGLGGDFVGTLAAGAEALAYFLGEGFAEDMAGGFMK